MLHKRSNFLCLFFAMLILSAGLSSCTTESEEQQTTAQQLDTLFQHYIDSSGFSGTVLVADSSGLIYSQAVGYQDFASERPMKLATAFYLASLSKSIHAAAVMYLADQGRLRFVDTLSHYLPDIPFAERITIQQLLTHTHGLPDYYGFMETFPGMTNADVLKAIRTIDSLDFEPGTQFSYSNTGYALLVATVEAITGERYAEFMQRTFFDPIGMRRTVTFDERADLVPNRAVAINSQGESDNYQFRTVGGGGIFSTIEDLYRWDQALRSEKYIRAEILQQAYQPTELQDGTFHPYGFGWIISEEFPGYVYHTGSLNGFRNYIGRWLGEQKLLIVLSNNQHEAPPELIRKVHQIFSGQSPASTP